jgi:hypothetical protein
MNTFQKVWYIVKKHKIRLAVYIVILDTPAFIFYRTVWWQFIPIVTFFDFILIVGASLNLYSSEQHKEKLKRERESDEKSARAKRPLDFRYTVWGIVCFFAILIGIGILPTQFLFHKIDVLTFIDISLLIFGAGGIFIIREKVAALKRVHPEFFKALEVEDCAKTTKCAICRAEPAFRFRCYYCKKYFCEQHKLPKSHHCTAAPKVSFRTVLLMSPVMIFLGIAILYLIYLYSIKIPEAFAFGGVLIAMGILFPLGRALAERQSNRALGLN